MSNSTKPSESQKELDHADTKPKQEEALSDEELAGVAGGTSFAVLLGGTQTP